jgi:hypothetical protein
MSRYLLPAAFGLLLLSQFLAFEAGRKMGHIESDIDAIKQMLATAGRR